MKTGWAAPDGWRSHPGPGMTDAEYRKLVEQGGKSRIPVAKKQR